MVRINIYTPQTHILTNKYIINIIFVEPDIGLWRQAGGGGTILNCNKFYKSKVKVCIEMKLKDQILKETEEYGTLTFAELSYKKGFNGHQEVYLKHQKAKNIILWSNVSKEAVRALGELLAEKKIMMLRSSILVYAFDGSILSNTPIAKRIRHYKKPHWLPVVLDIPERVKDICSLICCLS